MADTNKDLERHLIAIRNIDLCSSRPTIDMGWVYFRLGQLEMKNGWKKLSTGSQCEISARMGRYCGTFQEEDAIQIWKIGFNREPNNAILLETVDRLRFILTNLKEYQN